MKPPIWYLFVGLHQLHVYIHFLWSSKSPLDLSPYLPAWSARIWEKMWNQMNLQEFPMYCVFLQTILKLNQLKTHLYNKIESYLPLKIKTWTIVAESVANPKPYVMAKKVLRYRGPSLAYAALSNSKFELTMLLISYTDPSPLKRLWEKIGKLFAFNTSNQ